MNAPQQLDARPPVEVRRDPGQGAWVIQVAGPCTVQQAGLLARTLGRVRLPSRAPVVLDLHALGDVDTTGAWLVHRTKARLRREGHDVQQRGAAPEHAELLALVARHDAPCQISQPLPPPVVGFLSAVGATVVGLPQSLVRALDFLGRVLRHTLGALVSPTRLAVTPTFHHMEHAGLRAAPIVGLVAFLIGVVLAYQGSVQLRKFGAEVLVVDLVSVSLLREVGIFLTAVIVAGRSGSAFTAQIGSMKLNEEIDAMRTMALDPVDRLVVPRVLGLVLVFPALTIVADIAGLLGGAAAAWPLLDLPPLAFLHRLQQNVEVTHLLVGVAKAPFFAAVIGLVGCYHGFQVVGGADQVGARTTRSVVQSIFLVIVLDALLSVFFVQVGL